eukprot:1146814-Pelagomonas_calceolata.AAC.10
MQALGKQAFAKHTQRFPSAVSSSPRSSVRGDYVMFRCTSHQPYVFMHNPHGEFAGFARAMASKAHVCEPKWWTTDDVAVVTGGGLHTGKGSIRFLNVKHFPLAPHYKTVAQ